jgi:predicted phosphodiesterase
LLSAIVTSNCLAIALSLLACGCQPAAPQGDSPPAVAKPGLFFGPYVTAVAPTSATVNWITPPGAGGGSCRMVGDSSGAHVALETAAIAGRSEVRHVARITGLKADEMHRYVVEAGDQKIEGRFRTPTAEGQGKPFCFVITGDTQSFPLRIQAGAEMIAKEEPAFIVHTGDLCDSTQNWTLLEREFFTPWRGLLRQVPVWPIRGNHEFGNEPFASLFGLPSTQPWQSFDYGQVHVVCLDQWSLKDNLAMEPDRMEAMLAWLDKDLAAAKSKGQWILVGGHQPMFNVAGHGSTWGHKDVLPILYKYGVDVVFAGHSHLYERFVPIGPAGAKPIQFIVAGGGGGPNYPFAPSPILVKSYSAPHFSLYRVFGDRLELTIKGAGGETIDYFVMSKATDGAAPPRVMEDALTPEDAMRLLKVCNRMSVEANERPVGGRAMTCTLTPALFPGGSKVTLSSDGGSPWAVKEMSLEGVTVEDANIWPTPVSLTITPPPGVLLGDGQSFSPPLTLAVSIEYKGRHYACTGVPVGLSTKTLHRLAPAPEVADVPPAGAAIALDGNLSEWKDIPFLRLPSTGQASRSIKLAWRGDGLYGAVAVEQTGFHTDPELPWNGDSFEIDVESDARGRTRTGTPGVPLKVFLWPRGGDDGNVGLLRSVGSLPRGGVKAAWQKTPTGYTMEFCISAKALTAPPGGEMVPGADSFPRTNPLEADRRIGLDLILRHDGVVVEQFADTRAFRSTWGTPLAWGRVRLAEK